MRRKTIIAAMVGMATLVLASHARATSGTMTWVFQDSQIPTSGSTALAMRSGFAWPVVVDNNGDGSALFATPGPGSNWHEIGFGLVPNASPNLGPIGKSSADGRVAFFEPGSGTVAVAGSSGLFSFPSAEAAAFAPDGSLLLGDNGQIVGHSPANQFNGTIIDMAVAPDGTIGVLTDFGEYHEKRFGQWSDQPAIVDDYAPVDSQSLRLAFDAQNRPHIAGVDGGDIYTIDFSTQLGDFVATQHGFTSADAVPIAADDEGDVGIAWIEVSGDLRYAGIDGNGNWTPSSVDNSGAMGIGQTVGLAFDHDGLPVISYEKFGNIHLAYDPIITPEPTSLALFGLAGLMMLRRRA